MLQTLKKTIFAKTIVLVTLTLTKCDSLLMLKLKPESSIRKILLMLKL